ncbi:MULTISPECIES: sodium:solute symporter family transporter [Vibrio]|jgi:SSS family transporter|uniref:sodium:solute symporter family transporter n=1 Tax=Vibrio TaxID=662 RepID=UPI0004F36D51|nr:MULTISPECIES: transporter [Vibrio]MDG2789156.1 transporter [Vibrio parahaemolyticus]MDW1807543.1 transporter [Vibrio sp. Vb2362]QIR90675.1 transporter [Vibrio diabolicus]ALR94012.1 transporter [Vibrio alginolyticus]AVF64148.1 transporter [Vibrio alginolyticus]
MELNTLIVGIYFLFLIAIGWMFRTFTSTTSDYFRGGGNMLWWMVGATAFMTQFSAWTFTGAAGKAYNDGFAVAIIFLANAFGYFMNFAYFAPKFRQLRVVTVIEAIRMRFGTTNEQVFTWSSMPNSVVSAGVWLNALAIIASGIFGFDMTATIWITGLVVLAMSVTGGSWAVIASDFMQMVIIMAVTITCAAVAIVQGGGVTEIISNFPVAESGSFVAGNNLNYLSIFSIWAFFIFVKQFSITNNMLNSYRYLAAKDSKNAKKAALLACVLMLGGVFIWFMPSWYIAGQGVDLAAAYPDAGNKAGDFAYLYFVQEYMPAGMVGLLVAAMFAATMSSMDSGLNRNSGIFVKNFYEPIVRKGQASEKELVAVSKATSAVFGVAIILIAQFINSLKGLSLFDTMMYVGALIGFPMTIPAFLGFFIKKTPDWAGWGTLVVGGIVSYLVGFVITADMVSSAFGLEELTSREWSDVKVAIGLIGHMTLTGGFFMLSTLFYKPLTDKRQADVDKFFENLSTPLVAESVAQRKLDNKQRQMLGKLIAVAGIGVMFMALLPNPVWGRLVFILCGAIVGGVGLLLVKAVDSSAEQASEPVTES